MAEENSSSEDEESKTEEPSTKRLEEALEKGQVINSREVTSFLLLFASSIFIIWIIPALSKIYFVHFKVLIEKSGDMSLNLKSTAEILNISAKKALLFISPLLFIVVILPIFSAFAQQGQFVFSLEQIMPQLSRISIGKGLERLFSSKSVIELLKSLLKITVIGFFIYLIIMSNIKSLTLYQDLTTGAILSKMLDIVKHVLIFVSIIMAAIAGMDYGYQRYQYFKSLRMTKQELKEEFKDTEGNPQIKQKIRSLQMSKSRKRMMANVPKADVIITNPTHLAIALLYSPEKHPAPIVVAKGQDIIAAEIKKIAQQNDIHTVENKPLAKELYKVEIDAPIPAEHYEAVAKIISYVYALKNKKI
jgi:flagellar biosynthetic protein FlhB